MRIKLNKKFYISENGTQNIRPSILKFRNLDFDQFLRDFLGIMKKFNSSRTR